MQKMQQWKKRVILGKDQQLRMQAISDTRSYKKEFFSIVNKRIQPCWHLRFSPLKHGLQDTKIMHIIFSDTVYMIIYYSTNKKN